MEKQSEKVSLIGAVRNFFKYYATFSGRSSRSEYWWLHLAGTLLYLALVAASGALSAPSGYELFGLNLGLAGMGVISLVAIAGLIVPTLAVMARRLRDAGISPYFLFFIFLPILGGLALFVMMLFPSKQVSSDSTQSQP